MGHCQTLYLSSCVRAGANPQFQRVMIGACFNRVYQSADDLAHRQFNLGAEPVRKLATGISKRSESKTRCLGGMKIADKKYDCRSTLIFACLDYEFYEILRFGVEPRW